MRQADYDVFLGAAIMLCGMNGKCAECKYFTANFTCGLDGISGDEMPHDALCVAMALKRANREDRQ